ncbi:MAG: hypothetical protein JHC25_07685 [Thermodesulfobacterium sp.]|nr:hypothetical protein [Thermodesulfobacterium sp.]
MKREIKNATEMHQVGKLKHRVKRYLKRWIFPRETLFNPALFAISKAL